MMFPNDWRIKKCLVLSVSLLLAMIGLTGLFALGFDIPILRQIVSICFLTFIPGILLLRILKIHNINTIESLLYSVGLSLAFVMATGVMANFALPPLGISKPIALLPLLLIITLAFLLLCLLAYIRDKDFRPSSRSDGRASESTWQSFRANPAPYMLAILLPLLAILGANLVNAYQNNTLLFILIFAIALIIGLIAFNKFIPDRLYPFVIVMMSIALLYQTTLISHYLIGSDIHLEHYFSNLTIEKGYWDATIYNTINSCLSIVMLMPIYSLLLNMDIVWIFKIVCPLFFCLAPLALFRIFRLQLGSRYAFLATCFFITMPMFLMDMTQLIRQQVSELFFVLVILLLVDRKLTLIQRSVLVLLFGFGVVTSYYGLGAAYAIAYLTLGSLVLLIIKSRPIRVLWQRVIGKSNAIPPDLTSAGAFNKRALAAIVGISLIFTIVYYNTAASGAAYGVFSVPGRLAQQTTQQVIEGGGITGLDPMNKEPLVRTALGLDFPSTSPGGKVWRILQYLVELCIVIGFFRLIFRPRKLGRRIKAEYIALTITSFLILLGIFVLPTWSYGLGASRIWQITLLMLAPLFIFGGEVVAYCVGRLARALTIRFSSPQLSLSSPFLSQVTVLLIMIPYFLFNSGAIFELSRSQTTNFINMPYSIALSSYRVDLNTVFVEQDTTAADWLFTNADKDYLVYADCHASHLFWDSLDFHYHNVCGIPYNAQITSPSYIFLRTWNTERQSLTFGTAYAARQGISFNDLPWFESAMKKGDIIYFNGGAQIILNR